MHTQNSLKHCAWQERRQRAQLWLATLLSGTCCAVMAYVINLGIEGIDKLRFKATLHLIHPGGTRAQNVTPPGSPCNCTAGLLDWALSSNVSLTDTVNIGLSRSPPSLFMCRWFAAALAGLYRHQLCLLPLGRAWGGIPSPPGCWQRHPSHNGLLQWSGHPWPAGGCALREDALVP